MGSCNSGDHIAEESYAHRLVTQRNHYRSTALEQLLFVALTLSLSTNTCILHGPSIFAVKAKIYGVLYNQPSFIAFDETSSYWSVPKALNFSAFHWSPHGSLVSIGQHFVSTRVVHLPKRAETSLITESVQNGPNHQLLQLFTTCTTWSVSDQAVRAAHCCNSWFIMLIYI